MLLKINNKPIQVKEEEETESTWMYVAVSTIGYLLGFYVLDYCAALFLGIHPFPFIKFIGVIFGWFN